MYKFKITSKNGMSSPNFSNLNINIDSLGITISIPPDTDINIKIESVGYSYGNVSDKINWGGQQYFATGYPPSIIK